MATFLNCDKALQSTLQEIALTIVKAFLVRYFLVIFLYRPPYTANNYHQNPIQLSAQHILTYKRSLSPSNSTPMSRHWQQRLGYRISESTIRGWVTAYNKQLSEEESIAVIKSEKRGRIKTFFNPYRKLPVGPCLAISRTRRWNGKLAYGELSALLVTKDLTEILD